MRAAATSREVGVGIERHLPEISIRVVNIASCVTWTRMAFGRAMSAQYSPFRSAGGFFGGGGPAAAGRDAGGEDQAGLGSVPGRKASG